MPDRPRRRTTRSERMDQVLGTHRRYRLAAAVRAPMEHRIEPAGVPPRVIMETRGLHAAPVSASEHRSSTGTSTVDGRTILPFGYVQVRDLLRVRRQGLEPRTRGLRARTRSCRPGSARASCMGGHRAPIEHRRTIRCSIDRPGGGVVEPSKQRISVRGSVPGGRYCLFGPSRGGRATRRRAGLFALWRDASRSYPDQVS